MFLDQLLCDGYRLISSMAISGACICCPSLEWQVCAKWLLPSTLLTPQALLHSLLGFHSSGHSKNNIAQNHSFVPSSQTQGILQRTEL